MKKIGKCLKLEKKLYLLLFIIIYIIYIEAWKLSHFMMKNMKKNLFAWMYLKLKSSKSNHEKLFRGLLWCCTQWKFIFDFFDLTYFWLIWLKFMTLLLQFLISDFNLLWSGLSMNAIRKKLKNYYSNYYANHFLRDFRYIYDDKSRI